MAAYIIGVMISPDTTRSFCFYDLRHHVEILFRCKTHHKVSIGLVPRSHYYAYVSLFSTTCYCRAYHSMRKGSHSNVQWLMHDPNYPYFHQDDVFKTIRTVLHDICLHAGRQKNATNKHSVRCGENSPLQATPITPGFGQTKPKYNVFTCVSRDVREAQH